MRDHPIYVHDFIETRPMNARPLLHHPVTLCMGLRDLGGGLGKTDDSCVVLEHAIGPGPDRGVFAEFLPLEKIFDEAIAGE